MPDTVAHAWPTAPPRPADPAPATRSPEHALILSAQAGDRTAMRALYEQNVPMVFSFLIKRVGHDAADDLTAEVFTKAFERLDQFEWRGIAIRSWLLRIAFNEIVGRARKRSSSEVVTDEIDRAAGGIDGHEDRVVDAMSAGGDVLLALEKLSPPQRAAVELRYLRGLSVAETAVVLDLGEEAVRAVTYRALKTLRSALVGP